MAHEWPVLPLNRGTYAALHTDFWPWTEVLIDLGSRQPLTGVLDVNGGDRQARALWRGGEWLGGYDAGGDLDLGGLMRRFPRASVSFLPLDAAVLDLLWSCRHTDAHSSGMSWGMLRPKLVAQGFRGLVLGDGAVSFWEAGQMLSGLEPANSETPLLVVADDKVNPTQLVSFWNELLTLTARSVPVAELWRESALDLADDHPCLDPFAREVVLDGHQIRLLSQVPVEELTPALRAVFGDVLDRSQRRLSDLPLQELRHHPLWRIAGPGEA